MFEPVHLDKLFVKSLIVFLFVKSVKSMVIHWKFLLKKSLKKLYINNLVILIYQLLTIKRDTQIVEKKLIYKEFLTSTLSPGPGLGHGHGWACNRTLLQSPLCPCQSSPKSPLAIACLGMEGRHYWQQRSNVQMDLSLAHSF